MVNATDLKKGMLIKYDNETYEVISYQHVTPGNWRGMVQTKLRNIKTNSLKEQRFRSVDKFDTATIEQLPVEFMYQKGDEYVFMNHANYEEISLQKEIIADNARYLMPDTEVVINYFEGTPVSIQLPMTVDLKIVETAPPMKSATITNLPKPATLENGIVVQVPSFVEMGETIRVDTRDGHYVERVHPVRNNS